MKNIYEVFLKKFKQLSNFTGNLILEFKNRNEEYEYLEEKENGMKVFHSKKNGKTSTYYDLTSIRKKKNSEKERIENFINEEVKKIPIKIIR